MSKFKVGDKVKIPTTKSYGDPYHQSNVIDRAIKNNQEFLYIKEINNIYIVIDNKDTNSSFSGDFFTESDLELYDDFILPEKWVIRPDKDNLDIIKSKLSKILKRNVFGTTYFHYPEYGPEQCSSYQIEAGYTEITFEQFKKYVLKEEVDLSKLSELELLIEQSKRLYNL